LNTKGEGVDGEKEKNNGTVEGMGRERSLGKETFTQKESTGFALLVAEDAVYKKA